MTLPSNMGLNELTMGISSSKDAFIASRAFANHPKVSQRTIPDFNCFDVKRTRERQLRDLRDLEGREAKAFLMVTF